MKAVLNIMIEKKVMKRVKAKASLLDLSIPQFVERVLDINTQDTYTGSKITKVKDKEIKNE